MQDFYIAGISYLELYQLGLLQRKLLREVLVTTKFMKVLMLSLLEFKHLWQRKAIIVNMGCLLCFDLSFAFFLIFVSYS